MFDYQKVTSNFASVGDETKKNKNDHGNEKIGSCLGSYRLFFSSGISSKNDGNLPKRVIRKCIDFFEHVEKTPKMQRMTMTTLFFPFERQF